MSTVVVTAEPDPLTGRVIDGKYRIMGPLGEGGMAQVYTAEHLALEQLVAIKFLRRELAVEPEIAERFAREARTIAQLNSEHIVKVLDVGHVEGAGLFMVMEYLDGEDLQTRLGRIGPFPLAETIGYVIQAVEGLDQAHRKGIVHRDLKPENLFLARSQRGLETVKLLDFGISKQTGTSLSRLTQPQVAIGSPNYMAPEQLMGYDNIDARADVWSLGVVLYRLTTGALPFSGQSIAEVYARILHTEPRKPSDVCPGLPHAFDDLVMRCLKKSARERLPNVRALAAALREIVSRGPRPTNFSPQVVVERSRSVDPMSVTARVSTESSGTSRHWGIGAALGGLFVASVATLVFATHSLSAQSEPAPAFAAPGIDEPKLRGYVAAEAPDVSDVSDLPLDHAPIASAPSEPRAVPGASARRLAALEEGAAKPAAALPPASMGRTYARRGRAVPQPPRHDTDAAVSDFGGRH